MTIEEIQLAAEERMEGVIRQLTGSFADVRTGRANATILDKVKVEYYGVPTPVNQIAGVKAPDAHMLVIEPWGQNRSWCH